MQLLAYIWYVARRSEGDKLDVNHLKSLRGEYLVL